MMFALPLNVETNTGGRAVSSAACARKQVFSCVFHCHSQPLCGHRTAKKTKHVAFGKNAAVKQPSVRSLPFKTKLFIAAVKITAAVPTDRAR
jgi:hypothetical protein